MQHRHEKPMRNNDGQSLPTATREPAQSNEGLAQPKKTEILNKYIRSDPCLFSLMSS